MIRKRLTATVAAVALTMTLIYPCNEVFASSKNDVTEQEQEKLNSEDSEHNYEDNSRSKKIDELEKDIEAKQGQIKQAQEDKKKIQSNISNYQDMVDKLDAEKEDLANYVSELDADLDEIQDKIADLREMISDKEADIEQTEADLEEAERIQLEQYEAMKKRIKFMYEKGDTYYLEMILTASDFGDMVNKADYIEQLSDYDKKKLEEYIADCEYVEACKEALEAEKELLDEAKEQVEAEEENLEALISQKEKEITAKENDITNKEAAIREYEAELEEQTEIIRALEQAVIEQKKKLAEENGNDIKYDGGMFTFPAPKYTRVSDDYGWRIHPILGVEQFHNGVDLASPGGSPILCAYDGEVVAADYSSNMGNYIMVNHGDGLYTIYMHASALYVSKGEKVVKGEKIAAVGSTGRSTGNHLHFSVRLNGDYVSPWKYLSK